MHKATLETKKIKCLFLAGQIKFTAIIDTVESVVQSFGSNTTTTIRDISDVSGIEQSARSKAAEIIKEIA